MLRLHINMKHPQPRHISRTVSVLRSGGIAIFPTDTTYALGCDLYAKRSIDRIYQLKGMDRKKPLSFLCCELSEVARYAIVEDDNYRVLRKKTPGQYTFVLPASREVPKIVQSKKRAVGVRIPDSPVCLALIRELGHPLISTTVGRYVDDEIDYSNDPDEIIKMFGRSVELMLDGDALYEEPSSVIDLSGDEPEIIREGSGDLSWMHYGS